MRYLILTGGSIDLDFAADYIGSHTFDRILAADKGLEAADRLLLHTDVLLGDFDSAPDSILQKWLERPGLEVVRHNPVKDQTDTELAIWYALEHGADEIHIIGFTGTRIDHVLGTIQSLKCALDAGVDCVLADSHNRIRLLAPGEYHRLRSEVFGRFFSLIPFTERVSGVSLTGMKYPLENAEFTIGNSLGVSNEIIAKEAVIAFSAGILIEIQSAD